MSRALRKVTGCREALARLPELALNDLRQQWPALYKSEASPHLSRELLVRAVAYRMQEVALGGFRPERQRQLRQFAQQLNESPEGRISPRPELKPGTRLVREWQGRTYEVLVLDDGFSCRSSDSRLGMYRLGSRLRRSPGQPTTHHTGRSRPQSQGGSQPPRSNGRRLT